MKKILMLGTGGTIASRQTKDGLAPGLTPEDSFILYSGCEKMYVRFRQSRCVILTARM